MHTLKTSHSLLPRGDYGTGLKPPRNLDELKLLDFKEDIKCGFYRGEVRAPKPPRRCDDDSDEDEQELELLSAEQRERVQEVYRQHRAEEQIRKNQEALQAKRRAQGCQDHEGEEKELTQHELIKERRRLLSLTPLLCLLNAQQRVEILQVLEVLKCNDLTKTMLVEAGSRPDSLFMLVEGTCTLKIALPDGGVVEIERSVGEWFPFAVATDTATPYDLVATPGSTFLVIRGKKRLDELIKPLIKESMSRKIQALTALFKDLPVKSAVQLLSMSAVYDVRKGQVAIREGRCSSNLVIMVRGTCVITKDAARLSHVDSPHIFGQVSVYHELPNPVSVTTSSEAEFILLPKKELLEMLKGQPGLKSVARRLSFDSAAGVKWHFKRTTDASIELGGNTSVAHEEARQRQLIARTMPKTNSSDNAFGTDDELPKFAPPHTSTAQPQRPHSAMPLRRDPQGASAHETKSAVETGEPGRERRRERPLTAGGPGRASLAASLAAAELATEGEVEVTEAGGRGSPSGPLTRGLSADVAKHQIIEYINRTKRRGRSLLGEKKEKLEEPMLHFLKQSDMVLESGNSSYTKSFIHRVELCALTRTKTSTEHEMRRVFQMEQKGPGEIGQRHQLLQKRLARTMNKGTEHVLKWARAQVRAQDALKQGLG